MHRQHLWGPPAPSIDAVIRDFGAMQAQEFLPAKWSIAQRMSGVTDHDVHAAFTAGTLLRTHILRPTWHFVHADDIRWLLMASAPRVHATNTYYYRETGVDEKIVARSRLVFERVLSDGQQRTRQELAVALAAAGMPVTGVSLAHVIMHAELDGVLISGPMKGKQHTYMLLDVRVPGTSSLSRDEAVVKLIRRYFASHGPATDRDFSRWASFTLAETRRGLEMLGSEVVAEEVGDRIYWSVPSDRDDVIREKSAPPSTVIDLLQDYDEYVVGYFDSRDVMMRPDGPTAALVARRRPLLHDGRLIGFWKHTLIATGVEIETFIHRALTKPESDAMQIAADRFGAFLGVKAVWK
jgi:Winged helix DNA-binding domain